MRLCANCNKDKPLGEFSRNRRWCRECWNNRQREYARRNVDGSKKGKKWRASHPDYDKVWRAHNPEKVTEQSRRQIAKDPARSARYQREKQSMTAARADRHGYEWAGWELEIISDQSRTNSDLAIQLGRTYNAVKGMRQKIYSDPQTIERIGLSESGIF